MSGAPTPKRIVEAFAKNAVAPFITDPVPVASQTGITPGRASYDDGFVPLNMTPKTSGGIPPFGSDLNGILKAISSWCAALQAGQLASFDATAEAAFGGYQKGAILRGVTNLDQFWVSNVDANTDDPDVTPTNWVSSRPLYSAAALSGTNNVVLPGASDFYIDVDTTAGNITYTGFVAQRDGQRVTFSNVGANLLTLAALSGSSTGPRQIRAATDLSLIQNQSLTIQYSTGLGKWLVV